MSYTLIGKHEKDSRANRDGYVSAMLEMMEKNKDLIHVDCDLMGCINTGKLLKAFPGQTFNAGIAEQNAMGVAAGMAATGLDVFIHSFGCFWPLGIPSCRYMSSVPIQACAPHSTAQRICRLRTVPCTCLCRNPLSLILATTRRPMR